MWFILLFLLWFPHLLCVNILKQVHLSYVQSKYWHWIFAPETGMFRFAFAFNRNTKLLLVVVVMYFAAKLPIQNRFSPLANTQNSDISSNWLKPDSSSYIWLNVCNIFWSTSIPCFNCRFRWIDVINLFFTKRLLHTAIRKAWIQKEQFHRNIFFSFDSNGT